MRGLLAGGVIALTIAVLWLSYTEGPWSHVPEPQRGNGLEVHETGAVVDDPVTPGIRQPVAMARDRRPVVLRGRVVGLDHGLAAGLAVHVAGFDAAGVTCGPDGAFELRVDLPQGSHSVVGTGAFAIVEPGLVQVAADTSELAGISLSATLSVPVKVTLAIEPSLAPLLRAVGDVEWLVYCRGPESIAAESVRVAEFRMEGGSGRYSVDGRLKHVGPLQVTVVGKTATTHGSFPAASQSSIFRLEDGAFTPCHFQLSRDDFVTGRVVGSAGEPLLDAEIVVDGERTGLLTFGSGEFLIRSRGVGSLSARFGSKAMAEPHDLAVGERHGVLLRVDTSAMIKVRVRDRQGERKKFRVAFNNNSDCQGQPLPVLPTLVDGVYVLKQTSLPAGTRLYLCDAEYGEWREDLPNGVVAGQVLDLVVPESRRATVKVTFEGRVPESATIDLTEVDSVEPQRFRRPWFYSARIVGGGATEVVLSGLTPSDYFVALVLGSTQIAKDRLRLVEGDNRITLRLPK